MKRWVAFFAVLACACAGGPPKVLTPQSKAAWQAMRVIKALDLVRDTAIDANAENLMSKDETRKVVVWHQAALRVIQVAGTGWKTAVQNSMEELRRSLSTADQQRFAVYFALVQGLLNEVVAYQDCVPVPNSANAVTCKALYSEVVR